MRTSNGVRYTRRLALLLFVTGLMSLCGFYAWPMVEEAIAYKLPTQKLVFERVKPSSAIEVQDSEGRIIDYWYDGNLRLYRSLSEIDSKLGDYVVLLEDAKFFTHNGFDLEEIKNSVEKNMEKGKIKRGASTITQQLAKNLFLDKDRSFTRKLFEIPWALRIEHDLTKKQILELYLNVIEWGPGVYGAEAAARHYFDKGSGDLSVGQAMYLALIVPNPKRFDFFANPKMEEFINKKRGDFVNRLVSEKKITEDLKMSYLEAPFGLIAPDNSERRYSVSHEGSYAGARSKRAPWLIDIEKNLRSTNHTKGPIKLSIKKDLELRIQSFAEAERAESAGERFFIVKEGTFIRAFRKFKTGKGVSDEDLNSLQSEGFVLEEVKTMPWSTLIN